MDKKTFKTGFGKLLEADVTGLPTEKKLRYMKKWIKEYERTLRVQQPHDRPIKNTIPFHLDTTRKIGVLVRTTIREMLKADLLTPEKIQELQDERYCKYTFDINYPFLKEVEFNEPLLEQRRVNGY